jgi:Rrf2 family protein
MIRLNRTTEYGLMALRHMSRKPSDDVTSAREIADAYGLPFEITAKTLQRLKDKGLIESAYGAKGGYTLKRPLAQVSFAEYLELLEGPQAIVACTLESSCPSSAESAVLSDSCEYGCRCEIKHVMNRINAQLFRFLSEIRLDEFTAEEIKTEEEVIESDETKKPAQLEKDVLL